VKSAAQKIAENQSAEKHVVAAAMQGEGNFIVRATCGYSILPLLIPTRQRQSDLRDQIHREFVNLSFQFQKRGQLFIGAHNETLSVAMRVNNPDRSPVHINSRDAALTPSGFAEIVGDDPLAKTVTYGDCAAVLAQGVPKAKRAIPTTERLRYAFATIVATQSFCIQ